VGCKKNLANLTLQSETQPYFGVYTNTKMKLAGLQIS